MDKVDSTENVAEVLETRLNISAGAGAVSVSSHHDDFAVDVEVEFPHLSAIKEDLYVFQTIINTSITNLIHKNFV